MSKSKQPAEKKHYYEHVVYTWKGSIKWKHIVNSKEPMDTSEVLAYLQKLNAYHDETYQFSARQKEGEFVKPHETFLEPEIYDDEED